MHTAAGNEQDSAASVSAGRDTTNTRHSEPDVANWPQISARQRPRCRERLRRSWVCAPCGIRVTCVRGRGQEDSPQRAHPQPRRSVGSVPSDSRHHEFKPCRTPTGLGNRLCSWKRSRACLQKGGQGQGHRTGGQELPAAESRGLGCLPGWVSRGVSLSSDPQHAVCTRVIPSSSEMRELGGTVYMAQDEEAHGLQVLDAPRQDLEEGWGLHPLGEA